MDESEPHFRIRNWDVFQHYKDRCPPWIKLHYELLSSKDWVTLSDQGRILAIACMLIASRHDGMVPADGDYIKLRAYLRQNPDFNELVRCGFLEPCGIVQADASKVERMKAKDTQSVSVIKSKKDAGFEDWYGMYPRKVNKSSALRAWKKLSDKERELATAALSSHVKYWAAEGTDTQFIAHPSTWLNGKRWEDELKSKHLGSDDENAKYRAMYPPELQ